MGNTLWETWEPVEQALTIDNRYIAAMKALRVFSALTSLSPDVIRTAPGDLKKSVVDAAFMVYSSLAALEAATDANFFGFTIQIGDQVAHRRTLEEAIGYAEINSKNQAGVFKSITIKNSQGLTIRDWTPCDLCGGVLECHANCTVDDGTWG